MLRQFFLFVLLVGVAALGGWWWLTAPPVRWSAVVTAPAPDAANGEIIFNIGGCASCHAVPNQPDRLKLGGGLPIASSFGTFYAPNISPDPADGIGRWNEADFVNAVMKGISPGGTHYYPAFPYTSYSHATVKDVRDLFAYIKKLAPVSGKVRDHDLPFPFNIRRNVGIWKWMYFEGGLLMPDQSRSPQWNRGNYLVNSFGHCAECHSPRNVLGGIVKSQRFAGGPDLEQEGGWVPNITPKGIGDWSAKDLSDFLETGQMPDGDTAAGAMARVIKNTSQLKQANRDAIAGYLKSLPPVEGPPRPKEKEKAN
jgi:mono/diheme cytochrome c family protein